MECPWCGSKSVSAEFVDIGVGYQQVTPYQCEDCWASQLNPYNGDFERASAYERKIGWWCGPRCWRCLDNPQGRWVALGCGPFKGFYVICEHPEEARNYAFKLLTPIPG